MRLPRDATSTEGARALLFDRLVDHERHEPVEEHPLRVLSAEGLRASIQSELQRLLNTRSPTPAEELEAEGREWTVLDWGLPDYTGWYSRSTDARARLGRLMEATIEAFEPRLLDPRVTVEENGENERGLYVWIEGEVKIGTLREPVSFPLAIDPAGATR